MAESTALPRLNIDVQTRVAPQRLPPCAYDFESTHPNEWGVCASGGDFEPSTIIAAYRAGCFPWPHPDEEFLWFSPDPRAIIPPRRLHIARRLARAIRGGAFQLTVDRAFAQVIRACADRPGEGTWITPALIDAYIRLHELGWAHSVEAWTNEGDLAGGVYGIRIERMFGAESMFYRVTDGSKVALAGLMQWCEDEGIELVDIQVLTPHTARLGGIEIPRHEYLRRLAQAISPKAR